MPSTIFDHRGFADFLQIGFRLRLVLLGIHLLADLPLLRRVDRWSACCAHSATISTPCLVISGGVRWPIGVLSSTSRSAGGMSAEVLVDDVADRGVLHRLETANWPPRRSARARAGLRLPFAALRSRPAPSRAARSARSAASCIRSPRSRSFSPASWAAAATSFSPTSRLSLKRPRTRLVQTISALMRAFRVSGRMPWLSSDLVSWSGEMRIRCAMPRRTDRYRRRRDRRRISCLP